MADHLNVECSDQPLDFAFHPSRSTLLAAALVDGSVEVHDFQVQQDENRNFEAGDDSEGEDETILSSTPVHTQLLASKISESGSKEASCRSVVFSGDGRELYTGGSAGDFVGLDAERLGEFCVKASPKSILWRIPDASYKKSPIQTLFSIPDSVLMVSGDEAGAVRVWDTRLMGSDSPSQDFEALPRGCVHSWKEHEDYISGIEYSDINQTLLASSADCSLSAYDLRMAKHPAEKDKCKRKSDDQEDELLSIQLMKNGNKVVCGTGEGVLAIWSWGTWGDVSDRFPGHPTTIDAMLQVDEDTLLTGSSDGVIRVVQIQPDKFLGVLGDHGGFPIEKLQFNSDRGFVGSVTHDNIIRLFDANILKEDYDGDKVDADTKATLHVGVPATDAAITMGENSDNEWEDMDEDMDSDSDDSSSEDEGGQKSNKRAGRFKTENEEFFADL